jgi:cation diffusion facilitator family transporter
MKQTKINLKKRATKISVISNFCLIIIKLIAGIISGSISLISEAIHSSTDLLASVIAFFAILQSSKPADEDHQFGHGKYEYIASLFESLLIIFAGFCIAKEAFSKLYAPQHYSINTDIGLIVMAISIIVNYFVSKYLFNIAKQTQSPAIMADGVHLSTDMFSSVAVIVGLILVKITGLVIFDSVIALVVTVIIILTGLDIYKKAQENLLDKALTSTQIEDIKEIIKNYSNSVSIKTLKTRQTSLMKNIEITLIIDGNMSVYEAHKLCDKIENAIEAKLNDTEISIHLEPKEITQPEIEKIS